ncbi:hypothetical protein C4580_05695 [Candidatus Woesearchaeota archaeon]|nr:MAG: hypothetical protein C4580_05695 [Candidatus Woesearchaeota archaeon]
MKRLALLFILLASLLSASAQFVAFGETSDITLDSCTSTTRNLTVQNTAGEPATFDIFAEQAGAQNVLFSTTRFTLAAGQTGIITAIYNAPCEPRAQNLPVDIIFSDGTSELLLAQTIRVALPDTINITLEKNSQVIPPCGTATYPITIQNNANFTELYTLLAEGHDEAHISHPALVLTGKSAQTVEVTANPSDCTQSGSFPLTLTIESEKSSQAKQLTLELIITPTDIPELAPGISTIRSDFGDTSAELTIKNIGDRTTSYQLGLTGADFAKINPNVVTLKPGQTLPLQLRLTPTEENPEDTYPVTLTATVTDTGIAYTKELFIKLKSPTLLERNPVVFFSIILAILLGIALLIWLARYLRSPAFAQRRHAFSEWRAERKAIRARAKEERQAIRAQKRAEKLLLKEEKRAKKEAERAKRDAERKAEEEKQERERKRKEERLENYRAKLQAQAEKALAKQYHLVSRKEVKSGKKQPRTSRRGLLFALLGIAVIVALSWDFILPNLGAAAIGIILVALILITRKILRKNLIKRTYRLVPKDAPFLLRAWKSGLHLLRITAEHPIKNLTILIKRRTPPVKPSPTVLHTFTLQSNANCAYEATIALPKRLLKKHNATLDEVRLAKYTGTWKPVRFEKSGEDKHFVYITAPITTGTHTAYLKLKKQAEKPRRTLLYAGIALLALVTLIALGSRTENASGAIPPQVWKQDTVARLELGPYFADPDGGKLTFSATPTQKITIDFIGTTAVLTPEHGFSGEERVKFIATDEKGARVESNTVSLVVVKTWLPLHFRPAFSIVLGLLAILALLLTLKGIAQKK